MISTHGVTGLEYRSEKGSIKTLVPLENLSNLLISIRAVTLPNTNLLTSIRDVTLHNSHLLTRGSISPGTDT